VNARTIFLELLAQSREPIPSLPPSLADEKRTGSLTRPDGGARFSDAQLSRSDRFQSQPSRRTTEPATKRPFPITIGEDDQENHRLARTHEGDDSSAAR
jgi:hypothetical protein